MSCKKSVVRLRAFISSGGAKFSDVLIEYRRASGAWCAFITAHSCEGKALNDMLSKARNDMGSHTVMYQRISSFSVDRKEAVSFCAGANANLLSSGVKAVAYNNDVGLARATLAYANFQQSKERAVKSYHDFAMARASTGGFDR